MVFQLLLGLIFSIAPVMELRAAIPVVLEYCFRHNLPYYPFITLAILLNILAILLVFFFLEFLHHRLIKVTWYQKIWDTWVHTHLRKKIERVEKKKGIWQYLALLLFIAIPLPGTGVWTGATISWLLGLDKKKSFITLAIGASIAGLIILLISLSLIPEISHFIAGSLSWMRN